MDLAPIKQNSDAPTRRYLPPLPSTTTILLVVLVAQLHPTAANAETLDPNRYEVNAMPMLMGDSDRGVIASALGVVVRFKEGHYPYQWRLRVVTRVSFDRREDDTLELPFHDDRLQIDLPGLFHPRLRLEGELAFRRYQDAGYYGVGNNSNGGQKDRYNEYDRIYPGASIRARWAFSKKLALLLGFSYTYNWVKLYSNSKLEADRDSTDPKVRELIKGTNHHSLPLLTLGWLYDSRDHEFEPTRGMFHEISWRFSPAPYSFGGINLTTRFFYSLWGPRLVLGVRFGLDLLIGDVPVYELARMGGLFPSEGIGGGESVRGIPLQRYHGKIKLMANIEARSRLFSFAVFQQRFTLSALAFVDTGRLWSDFDSKTRFDGDNLGLKLGLGGGMRLRWGETFVLRGDVAWSPDASPVGAYVGLNHLF
jgi:hypothetical protein